MERLLTVAAEPLKIALYYDDSAYRETLSRPARARADRPAGLMGREVAGKEFLDAYLSHGQWSELAALTPNAASGESLKQTCRTHPSSRDRQRRLQLFTLGEFHDSFLPNPPAPVLHFPCPPDPRYAWARPQGPPHGFALSGVTHTLCSPRAIDVLRRLVTAPFEPYDRLICTSRAVTRMVQAVVEEYCDHLRERHGGTPRPAIGLETIPLGVNTETFRPPTPAERAEERRRLNVADDETAVLFVGRLSHHAKAHPFPMFRGVAHAAESTGTKAHLLLVGWAATAEVQRAFESAAQLFAPRVRVSFVDGRKREYRFGAWRAADVFMSLSDNIQETFGLVIVEAMASGLPVVATDWNGYRDLVTDGETGFLIPTLMLPGATADVTSRLLVEEINYDHFLARCSQAVAVDCAATSQALVRLFEDAGLRQRMGAAGRRRAVEQFAWPRIIQRYEALWRQQDAERRACAERSVSSPRMAGPAAYPPPERSFAGYPTRWLDEEQSLQTAPDAAAQLNLLLSAPLTNHEASSRGSDPAVLQQLLHHAAGSCSLAELDAQLRGGGLTPQAARATLAWMMKYDLLRPGET